MEKKKIVVINVFNSFLLFLPLKCSLIVYDMLFSFEEIRKTICVSLLLLYIFHLQSLPAT